MILQMRLAFVALALASCIRSELVICDDGRACPTGTACDLVHATCVAPQQLEVCKDAAAGENCEAAGVSGRCERGVCLLPTIAPFGTPEPLVGINTAEFEEDDASLTGDLTEIFLLRQAKIWTSQRASATAAWPAPRIITELDGPDIELRPSVSADGRTLYFTQRPAGQQGDIYVSTRTARGQPWSPPSKVSLDIARPDAEELAGWSSPDGSTLLVTTTTAAGKSDLFRASRTEPGAPFTSVLLDGVNSPSDEDGAWATGDGSQFVFNSNRFSTNDIWEAVPRGDTWSVAPHSELSTGRPDTTPWLSPDGAVIVFTRSFSTDDLFMATRAPQR